jgi:bacterioferritin-associated ferredoxin
MTVYSSNVFSDQDVRSTVEAERTPSTGRVSGCPGRSAQCGRCVRTTCPVDEALGQVRHPAPAVRDPGTPGPPTFVEDWPLVGLGPN